MAFLQAFQNVSVLTVFSAVGIDCSTSVGNSRLEELVRCLQRLFELVAGTSPANELEHLQLEEFTVHFTTKTFQDQIMFEITVITAPNRPTFRVADTLTNRQISDEVARRFGPYHVQRPFADPGICGMPHSWTGEKVQAAA